MLDPIQIRKDFPLFNRLINDKPIVYLDSTASTPKPQQVIDAQDNYYRNFSVNIFRGVYKLSEEATTAYEDARIKVGQFIGAIDSNEIVFVRNATEGINLVASSWGGINVGVRDEIVSSVMEHHANIVPWQQLAINKKAHIRYADITEDGLLDIDHLKKLITTKTKLVALTYVSNVLGTINPVKEIVTTVKELNPQTLVLIDAAQAVPHMSVDVNDLGCDFLVFSGHKMCGPTGIGVLWGRKALLDAMPPYQTGGEMIREVTLEKTTFNQVPYRFEAGTPHIAGAIGLSAAADYLQNLSMDEVAAHEKDIVSYALDRLAKISEITLYGPFRVQIKGGVIAFSMRGTHPHDVAQVLDNDNICVRSGHHCAMPLHKKLGVSSTCRASFYIYTTKEDVDALVEGVEKAKKILRI